MNKIKSLVPVILILLVLIALYFKSKSEYNSIIHEMNSKFEYVNLYSMAFDEFFSYNFRYPESIDELKEFNKDAFRYNEFLNNLKDPFTGMKKDFLYIPVFSNKNKLCEGYMLISAGIDRVINSHFNDTVFFEDMPKLEFYNNEFNTIGLKYRSFTDNYDVSDRLFGKKDMLIVYSDGIRAYRYNASKRKFDVKGLFRFIRSLNPNSRHKYDCSITGIVKEINNNNIILTDSCYTVVCNLYSGEFGKNFNYLISKEIKIIGQYNDSINVTDNIIYLDNCIIVNDVNIDDRN